MCAEKLEQQYQHLNVYSENYLHPDYIPKSSNRLRHSISSSLSMSLLNDSDNDHKMLPLRSISQSVLTINDENCSDSVIKHGKKVLNASNESICFGKCKKPQAAKEIFELLRPRCYTDPGPPKTKKSALHVTVPLLKIESDANGIRENNKKKRKESNADASAFSIFDSLIKQTFTLTTVPVGITEVISDERLTQNTSSSLNEDVKYQISRSTNSVVTLPNGIDGAISNDSNLTSSASSTLLESHTEAQSVDCLNQFDLAQHSYPSDYDPDNLNESLNVELRRSAPNQRQPFQQHKKQLSLGSTTSQNSGYYSSLVNDSGIQNLAGSHKKRGARTLKQNKSESAISTNSTLGLDTLSPIPSTQSVRSASPTGSKKSATGSICSNHSDNTAKNEHSTAAAVASTTAVAATGAAALALPTEKEKKRKEVSSSRVKKFHRHFSQVPKDEKLINYYSCALVSDILLQGHLYITDKHFAFYSNVFGYVTKVVIPTSSVTKISKEKTAKIIPNAVGVATADERHVFGSFISREAAFRLMCSVCQPLEVPEILPKITADIEISEECSIEDDSSCSISGNESPPANGGVVAATNTNVADTGQALLRRNLLSSSLNNSVSDKKSLPSASNDKLRHSDIPTNAKATNSKASNQQQQNANTALRASAPPSTTLPNIIPATKTAAGAAATAATNLTMIIATGPTASVSQSASSTSTSTSTSSSPTTVMATPTGATETSSSSSSVAFHIKSTNIKETVTKTLAASLNALTSKSSLRLKFPTELSIVYLGVVLSLILAVFSVFLLYRIVDIESRATLYRSPMNFNWHTGHDDDIFAEALRWQRQLQEKNSAEAQNILTINLEQIAKVRRSLETLSMLIRDRSSASSAATVHHDDSSD